MTDTSWLLAAALSGLFSAGHCLPMCGGFVTLLAQSVASQPFWQRAVLVLGFSVGRVATYTLLGLGLGAIVQAAVLGSGWQWLAVILRLLSGLLLILMGLYVARFWFGLTRLERLGARLWPKLQPALQTLRSIRHPGQALAAGAIWGLLPCGLVYSALATAATRADANEAALFMTAFGLGTLPALTAAGLLSSGRSKPLPPALRVGAGLALIGLGLWIAAMSLQGLPGNADPHQHHHHVHAPAA
ncbi:MAG: sulfite exporter TauE/SafE family protein [Permianibacter sp.]